jgi:hypothetical protein
MPYKQNDGKWRGTVKRRNRRFTSVHLTKAEAKDWEVRFKKHLDETSVCNNIETHVDLKEKYHRLYKDPLWTIGNIVDEMAKDFELPFRYSDVLNIAKAYYKRANERLPAALRMQILERDDYTCRVCGAQGNGVKLHVDHIIPRSYGGATEERNLRTLCEKCNLGKHNIRMSV